eukprot:TRINITY_DN21419_c0_g1_i1.p3 TRINITY_DN21419_c0_g1~~TRINITY_DN21419_c0_g1_i1.p3  ORF type:complete len:163 (+),score=22.40 TRINITY_DN21419_c0_g1_i1:331-819(+)
MVEILYEPSRFLRRKKNCLKQKQNYNYCTKDFAGNPNYFFREPLDNFKYIEDRIPPLVFWIKDYFDCFQDTESILKRIKEVNSKLSKENAEYIAFLEILRSIVFKVHDIERLINDKENQHPMYSALIPVSYTHLTLPTILLVQISVVAVSLKKKKPKTNQKA